MYYHLLYKNINKYYLKTFNPNPLKWPKNLNSVT